MARTGKIGGPLREPSDAGAADDSEATGQIRTALVSVVAAGALVALKPRTERLPSPLTDSNRRPLPYHDPAGPVPCSKDPDLSPVNTGFRGSDADGCGAFRAG